MPSRTIGQALAEAAGILRSCGMEQSRLDAEVILAFLLKITRTQLYIRAGDVIEGSVYAEYFSLIRRRAQNEPVAYITGEKEFMSLPFRVSRAVLIPRPDTELMVEEALALKPLLAIDVGTGSGAIAVSLASYLPECRVWAVDISREALEVARSNALRHGVDGRIAFYQGDLLEPLDMPENAQGFDVVTANLPYIPASEMDKLPRDVACFEPRLALEGGEDGLDHYRKLCPAAARLLRKGGILLLEIGFGQAPAVREILKGEGFGSIEVVKDLAGLERVVKAEISELANRGAKS